MKNHKWVDGSLLQTNKKWSDLKQSQRDWIYEMTRNAHAAYIEKHRRLPRKKCKEEVIAAVNEKLNERKIWIPYHEFYGRIVSYIDRLNRKSSLLSDEKEKEASE